MPDAKFMLTDGKVQNLESPVFASHDGIRMVDNEHGRTHPRVNVRPYIEWKLLRFRHRLRHDALSIVRLQVEVKKVISHRKPFDIVYHCVVVQEPNFLVGANNHCVRNKSTVFSVENDFIIGLIISVDVAVLFEIGMNRKRATWEIDDDIGDPFRLGVDNNTFVRHILINYTRDGSNQRRQLGNVAIENYLALEGSPFRFHSKTVRDVYECHDRQKNGERAEVIHR